MTEESKTPTELQNKIKRLMSHNMPPFATFVAHNMKLREECEKAGRLTEERAALFAAYEKVLKESEDEYHASVEEFIATRFSTQEIDDLVTFYEGPLHALLSKMLALGPEVHDIGMQWATRCLERCPETWQMFMDNINEWQRANLPEDVGVVSGRQPGEDDDWVAVKADELEPPPAA